MKKKAANGMTDAYDELKRYKGQQYLGMKIGRSHHWAYDAGDWKETKITPDLWEISYAVTKRRKGHAPKNSGVPVGTGYQWCILAYQKVLKLNADDYTTELSGLKFKLAHKRAGKGKWNISSRTQRAHLIGFLKEMIAQMEAEPIPLSFDFEGQPYKGEAIPITVACDKGFCPEAEITLNDENFGIIKRMKSGWKLDRADKKWPG